MATLTGQTIAASYEQLLHVDRDGGGNTTNHVNIKDGDNGTTFGFTIATDALMMTSTNRLEFGDTGTYIHQSADGVLDLVSDTEVEINGALIDINSTGAMTLDAAGAITFNSSGGAISIGNDAVAQAIDIGNSSSARTITIGNASSTATNLNALAITLTTINALTLTDGTATLSLGGTGATSLSAATSVDLDCTGNMQLNSSGGVISIGNDDIDQDINIGTAGERTISIGTGSFADEVVIGNTTGASGVHLLAGTGDVQVTGNLGIGVAEPFSPLHVQDGSIALVANSADNADRHLEFYKSRNATDLAHTVVQAGDCLGSIIWYGSDGGAWEAGAKIVVDASGTIDSGDVPAEMSFWTCPTGGSGASPLQRMTIDNAGLVGIGTTSIDEKLHVQSTGSTHIKVEGNSDGDNAGLILAQNGTTAWSIYADGGQTDDLYFVDTGSAKILTLQQDGNVGIGAAAPANIDGTGLEIKGSSHATLVLRTTGTTDASDTQIKFYDTTSLKWNLYNDGGDSHNFKILDHDGAQGVVLGQNDGDGFGVVSDERWKTEWTEYSGALNGIKTLRAGKYKFKNLLNGNIPDVWNSGLMAQDVEKILPDCVHTTIEEADNGDSFERKTLSYQAMIPYLVKAIQELSAKVTVLENA